MEAVQQPECPPGFIVDAVHGCRKPPQHLCESDRECPTDKMCVLTKNEVRDCVPVCLDAICPSGTSCVGFAHQPGCQCLPGYERLRNQTDGSCAPNLCHANSDCREDEICGISHSGQFHCIPVCDESIHCGKNAICRSHNRKPICSCPAEFKGDPEISCERVDLIEAVQQPECIKDTDCQIGHICEHHQCSVGCRHDHNCPHNDVCINGLCINGCTATQNCPGNLVCLDSHTCGCPPSYIREDNYCFIKTQNCTTTDPCNPHEECVYVGDSSGFCVCPHGYELLPYGECRLVTRCGDNNSSNPCAEGAICRDKPGSYECVCPIDTTGDPYVKGCKPVVGCTTDHDCPNDRECDTVYKQCISPCHICGPFAECTVRDHEAICICTHGKIGEPYNKQIGCFSPPPVESPPEVRTIPPVQDLQVMCLADGVQVSIQLGGYDGIIYVKGHSNDANCRRLVTTADVDTIDFKVLFDHCGLIHVDGEAGFVLVVQKHPRLVTYRARAYHIKCVYSTGERTVTLGFNVSMITTSGTIANTGPPPTCLMSICTLEGREISSAEIGDDLLLKVDVQPDFIYGGFARSCVAKTMEDEGEFQYEVTDANGCATDPSIFGNWEYDPHAKQLMARFNAFKFPSSNNLRFQCNIRVCFGSCPPVNCDGVDAYGRRRRREVKDEDLLLTDVFKEGALREEIMVQSNAILTFEKRDPQPSAPIEGPRIEDIDHVCLSRFGLILSMIITTLLALVAVAVAISCWLMAYRSRPKRVHRSSSMAASSMGGHTAYSHSQLNNQHQPSIYGGSHLLPAVPVEPTPDYHHYSSSTRPHHRTSSRPSSQHNHSRRDLSSSRQMHMM